MVLLKRTACIYQYLSLRIIMVFVDVAFNVRVGKMPTKRRKNIKHHADAFLFAYSIDGHFEYLGF